MPGNLEERIEAAIREDVDIVAYDPQWPRLFELEAKFLRKIIPSGLIGRVEHFGSTAVPGLAAKPIIDILVEILDAKEARQSIVRLLEKAGYDYFWRTDVSPAYSWFIKRDSAGGRTHHIHMVERDSALWERLYFRDYLREFPEEAKRYEGLKRELARHHPNDRVAYTAGKTEFIVGVTERARRRYAGV